MTPNRKPSTGCWLLAASHRAQAAYLECAAVAIRTKLALHKMAAAFELADAPYLAEQAVARFEGRVPPSREVFEQEQEQA